MTSYVNPSTRVGGTKQVVVAERAPTVEVDEAPFDDTQYVRVNGEWQAADFPEFEPDTLAPNPPTNLSASGALVDSSSAVDVELTWDAPTTNTDGSGITDLAYYVVRWRYADSTGPWASFVANEESAFLPGLEPGRDLDWAVLARDTSGNDSTWAEDTMTGVSDTTPPGQPSTPSLSSRLGTIRATWDGLLIGATEPPADFSHLDVFVATVSGGPWTYVDRLAGAGSSIVSDVPIGDTRYVSFIAVDSSGNTSARSAEASIVAVGVTGDDIEANSVTANHIEAGSVTAEKIAAGAVIAEKIDAGAVTATKIATGAVTAAKIDAGAVTSDKIDAGAVTAAKIDAGAVTATKLAADAIDGKTITGATIRSASSGQRVEINSTYGPGSISLWTDNAHEAVPAQFGMGDGVVPDTSELYITGPEHSGPGSFTPGAQMLMNIDGIVMTADGSLAQTILLRANEIALNAVGSITVEPDLKVSTHLVTIQSLQVDRHITAAAMRPLRFQWSDAGSQTRSSSTPAGMLNFGGSGVFVAPASGTIEVIAGGTVKAGSAGQRASLGFEIREGNVVASGTVVYGFDAYDSAQNYEAQSVTIQGRPVLVTGLTPGADYNIRNMVAAQGPASAQFNRGWLKLTPDF